jgi:hypothetical protein
MSEFWLRVEYDDDGLGPVGVDQDCCDLIQSYYRIRPTVSDAPIRLRAALAELVRLKDGPRDDAYRAEKDAAWQSAREALTASEAQDALGAAASAPQHAPVDAGQGAAPASKKGLRP